MADTPHREKAFPVDKQMKGAMKTAARLAQLQLRLDTKLEIMEGLNAAGIGVVLLNRELEIQFQPEGFTRFYGQPQNKPCHKYYYDQDSPCENCAVIKTIQSGKIQQMEKEWKKGHWISITAVPIPDSTGKPVRYLEVIQDITERVTARAELVRSEDFHRSIIEQLPAEVGVVVHRQDHVLYASPSVVTMLEAEDESQIIGRHVNDFQHPDFHEITADRRRLILHDQQPPKQIEIVLRTITGKEKSAINSGRRCLYNGEPALVTVVHEITAMKQYELEQAKLLQQLQQSQKLEAIGTLASGIAHDFNNLLSPIMSFNQLLEQHLDVDNKKARKYSQGIKACAKRAADLVRQILNISRHSEKSTEVVDLLPVIKETVRMLHSALPSTIEIQTSYQAESTHVQCDPTQIHQVLLNLGTNAGYAMRDTGGILEITASNHTETSSNGILEPGTYLLITVRDTGTGMSSEILDRIFDPFFTTKKTGEGTGLGLSVSYRIIKSLNGYIHPYSETGEGSKFHVYLPLSVGKMIDGTSEGPRLPRGHETIMLIDDEACNVDSNTELLRNIGYSVEGYTDSRKALDAFQENPDDYDLVLTDYTMPRINGLQLAERIRELDVTKPILLISGLTEAIPDNKIADLEISQKISKPVDYLELATAVRNALDR